MGASEGPVMVVSGDASRTGTPRLLLSLLRQLHDDGVGPLHVLLMRGGPLLADLREVAEVRVLNPRGRSWPEAAATGLDEIGRSRAAAAVRRAQVRAAWRRWPAPDVVWLNGAESLRVADALPPARLVVSQIHELQVGLDRSLAGLDVDERLQIPDRIATVSDAVTEHLAVARHVDRSRLHRHRGWLVDEPRSEHGPDPATSLGLPPDALVVGGCGTIGWRKGTDLFVALAQRLGPSVAGRPLHWVWLGEGPPVDQGRVERDRAARGVRERVHLVGGRSDPAPWFERFDLFALTSREDPFPLVALEAGARSVPVVAFDAGGAPELLADWRADCLVAPLDLPAFADRIRDLATDERRRRQVGDALAAKVRAEHRADVAARCLWADLTER